MASQWQTTYMVNPDTGKTEKVLTLNPHGPPKLFEVLRQAPPQRRGN